MANVFLSARKSTCVKAPVASATVIEVGDLLYHDSSNNDVRPASSQADNGDEESNQAEFARNFAGVAKHASANGDTDEILVETSLEMEYSITVPSGTYRLGAKLGASEASSGTALEDQQLEAVSSEDIAIAVVTDDSSSARTTVKCRFIRSVFEPALYSRAESNTATMTTDLTLTHDSAKFHFLDPGGSARTVTLPPEEESDGLMFVIANRADMAEVITIQNDASATVCTPTQNETAIVVCDGATWAGLVGADS